MNQRRHQILHQSDREENVGRTFAPVRVKINDYTIKILKLDVQSGGGKTNRPITKQHDGPKLKGLVEFVH